MGRGVIKVQARGDEGFRPEGSGVCAFALRMQHPLFTLHLPRYLAVMLVLPVLRRQHPWFTLHLPRYLAVMQADTLASSAMIDDEVVAEVVKLGFRRAEVIDAIHKRVQNKVIAQQCHYGKVVPAHCVV